MEVMAGLTPFFLLCISAGTLLLLTRIIKKYVCRAKARRTTSGSSRESEPMWPVIDGDEEETLKTMIERLGEAEERSEPEFKFSFRFPDDIVRRVEGHRDDSTEQEAVDADEEEALDATTLTISNYRLAAERNISGFMVHPEGLNCRVQESFVNDSGFSSLPDSRNIEERETEEPSVKKDDGVVVADEPEDEEETTISVGGDAANEEASNPHGGFFFHIDEPVAKDQRNCRKSDEDDKTLADEPEDEEETAISVGRDAANEEASDPHGGFFSHIDGPVDKEDQRNCPKSDEEGKTVADEPEDGQETAIPVGRDAADEFTKETSNPKGGFDELEDKDRRNCPKSDEEGKTLANEVEDDGHGLMPFDSDGGVVRHGSIDKENDGSAEEESEPKALRSKPDVVSERDRETPARDHFLAEEDFDGVWLDSCSSISVTDDGYSVRSLVIDADSDDGFLSDSAMCGLEEEEAIIEEEEAIIAEEEAIIEEEEAIIEEEEARGLDEEERHIDRVIQEAKLVIARLSSSVERPDGDAYSEECDGELEGELRNLEEEAETELEQGSSASRKEEEVALPHLSSSDEEFGGSDELSCRIADTKTYTYQSDDEEDEALSSFHLPKPETTSDGSPEQAPGEELGNAEEEVGDDSDEKHGKAGAGKKRESDELEALWEHQDLIEQLSEELMFVRSTGLETIHEEPRSPNLAVKLGDWKFDAAFLHEKPNDELQTFYKIYRERMRKLDILNYQKMYAIDFLQLKDVPQSLGRRKPKVASLLAHSFLSRRSRKHEDRSEKFVKELHGGLENVYVGQTCLSWEFLSWQYEKAQDLANSDPYGRRRYNRVAGEFRHFQVLIRRFLENEPFEFSRVPNYVKSRRDLADLLKVPLVKEDDRMKEKHDKGSEVVTLEELGRIMAKSIKLFWQLVRADKDEKPTSVKGLVGSQVELQDPTDGELMQHVQEQLHKKQKKLKDVLRVGNCLVKKLKRPEEDGSSQDQFFSQVDMKLVSRVLQMPRLTTEQLVWCHNKLSNITILGRDVQREIAFLPFPCST